MTVPKKHKTPCNYNTLECLSSNKHTKHIKVLLCFLCCYTVVTAQTVLHYTLDIGDSFTVQQQCDQIIVQNISNDEQTVSNTIGGTIAFEVKKNNDHSYVLDFSYQKLYMKTHTKDTELMAVHTDSLTDDIPSKMFSSILNQPLSITLQKTGEITNITGNKQLMQNVLKTLDLDPITASNIKKMLESSWGDSALISSLEPIFYLYTTTPVHVGSTWKNQYTGKLNTQNTWTLKNIEENSAKISCDSEVQLQSENQQLTMSLSGKQETIAIINPRTGVCRSLISAANLTGETIMDSRHIPTTITQKNTFTFTP